MKKPVVTFLFAAMMSVGLLAQSACETTKTKDQPSANCQCPVIAIMEEETEEVAVPDAKKGQPPVCAVCTMACEEYAPCAESVIECPAQNRKTLKACPLCPACKEKIRKALMETKDCPECQKIHKACAKCLEKRDCTKVKDQMTPEDIAANRKCKECPKVAEAKAKECMAKHAKECKTDCAKSGKCKCTQPCDCKKCGTPDCTCPDACAVVVITEEEMNEILPAPAVQNTPAPAAIGPAPAAMPAPAAVNAAEKAADPVPAPAQNTNPPGNINPPEVTPAVPVQPAT